MNKLMISLLLVQCIFAAPAIAKTSESACEEFAPDLLSELVDRGYAPSVPFSCNGVETYQGHYTFTLVVNGVKEVVYCDSTECK